MIAIDRSAAQQLAVEARALGHDDTADALDALIAGDRWDLQMQALTEARPWIRAGEKQKQFPAAA